MKIRMIDLFAGIGGIRIAFERYGAKCVASSEIDKYACKTYEENFGDTPLGDITKIDAVDLPDFEILTAGFPCQPFSIGGLRKGFEDTRGTLFFEVARILRERQPYAFLLENVSGLVSHDHGNTISVIEQTLSEIGYNFSWKIMNACDYGIPQNRNRWYCVGFRKDLNISFSGQNNRNTLHFSFPEKCNLRYTLKDIIEKTTSKEYTISPIAQKNIERYLPEFKNSKRYQEKNILIANEVRPSRCNFRNDNISPCLTAKMGTGGNNVPILLPDFRKLTEEECLKIMGFPDWYNIRPNYSHSYKQIGNSVVVGVIELLAKEMIHVLRQIKRSNKKKSLPKPND